MLLNNSNTAKAYIKGGREYPRISGVATFKETKNGVLLIINAYGLPEADGGCKGRFFGMHIHEGNPCSGTSEDEFANSKGHYNPNNCVHPYHVGDLPPLLENNGYAYMSVLLGRINIKDIIGKTIIIHDKPDDFTSQPSGNSGKKIACGVIRNDI